MPAESEGMIGDGTSFLISSTYAPAGVYTAVAELVDINPLDIDVDDVDLTHMDSPDDFKEYTPGLGDGGEVELDLNFEEDMMAVVYALVRVKRSFRCTNPDTSKWDYKGYLKTVSQESPHDGKISAKAVFKVSGKPVFTPVT